jgi:hypothetical protein
MDVFGLLRADIVQAGARIVKDLNALPEDKVVESPGGSARPAADFVYEVAFINRRCAMRLRGEAPPPVENEPWIVAPEGFRTKDALTREMEESTAELLAGFDQRGPNGLTDLIPLPREEWTVFQLATFVTRHMNYHDAQLNYLQSLYGDLEVHW